LLDSAWFLLIQQPSTFRRTASFRRQFFEQAT
jgi:hypothetical protein